MGDIEREIYAGPANGFFDKDNFTSVMKLMNAQVRDREGSITAFEIDGVRIEYCITYAVGSRPHRANVKLAGQKNKVDWLESIIESEKDIFGKK